MGNCRLEDSGGKILKEIEFKRKGAPSGGRPFPRMGRQNTADAVRELRYLSKDSLVVSLTIDMNWNC